MRMKTLTMMMAMTLLTACATAGNQGYNQAISGWQGSKIQSVTSRWGKPDAMVTDADGNMVYTYVSRSSQAQSAPVSSNYSTMVAPGGASIGIATPIQPATQTYDTLICTTTFKVNKDNVILSTKSEGNNCVVTKNTAP